MSDHLFGILDMVIVGVAVLGFAIWQLVSVNREIARDKQAKSDSPKSESPESAGHSVGEHRLDDR